MSCHRRCYDTSRLLATTSFNSQAWNQSQLFRSYRQRCRHKQALAWTLIAAAAIRYCSMQSHRLRQLRQRRTMGWPLYGPIQAIRWSSVNPAIHGRWTLRPVQMLITSSTRRQWIWTQSAAMVRQACRLFPMHRSAKMNRKKSSSKTSIYWWSRYYIFVRSTKWISW